jgi:hypothetical protein
MATLPAFMKRTEMPAGPRSATVRTDAARFERDPFELRALPHEDVVFFCKKIDNSRLVREADPRAKGTAWTAIGAASVTLALLTLVIVPNVANTVAGYKLEALRSEASRLADERHGLELKEAELLSPERLDKLAQGQHLVTPGSSQIVHLDSRGEGKVAMVKQQ